MAVTCIALSDAAIKRAVADQSITEIRDPRFPLRLRLASSRSRGSWHLITYKDGKANWAKVADWPLVSAKAMLDDLPSLSMQHRQDQSVKVNTWLSCGGLLNWYLSRSQTDTSLSLKRKRNIKCAITKHLIPVLGDVMLSELNHHKVDELLIWPLQARYALGSVRQYYAILRKAFKQATVLKLISDDPLASLSFTDFISTPIATKPPKLQSTDLLQLLTNIGNANDGAAMLIFIMLAYGTRIGETRLLRWTYYDEANAKLVIPADITKTHAQLTIPITPLMADVLRWHKAMQEAAGYRGGYLFPHPCRNGGLDERSANSLVKQVSNSEWTAHDLRKLARSCWADLGIDYMVAEQMLNHSMTKLDQAYIHTYLADQKRAAIELWHSHLMAIYNPFIGRVNQDSAKTGINCKTA
ncbi:site-specific integrase [Shewanella baltica]|uniref:tyrosine-type recombinase/integrase n=1 Tax=Shewanella baltica TaxID=62322 RepID=UPI00217F190A|nr:tyrosine-type recombinase/integrase [Shewanella baltica]MCS6259857.1 site-specific integrase [Shewanella baltica]